MRFGRRLWSRRRSRCTFNVYMVPTVNFSWAIVNRCLNNEYETFSGTKWRRNGEGCNWATIETSGDFKFSVTLDIILVILFVSSTGSVLIEYYYYWKCKRVRVDKNDGYEVSDVPKYGYIMSRQFTPKNPNLLNERVVKLSLRLYCS